MAGNYSIPHVDLNDDFSDLRVPTLETETGSMRMMTRAVTYRDTQRFIDNTYLPHVEETFYEAFLRVDLQTLRHIDSDPDKQESFINRRLPPNVADRIFGRIIPVIFMMVDIKAGDTILDGDIEYINHILMWAANRIYVTPMLNFADAFTLDQKREIYVDFIRRLLEQKNRVRSSMRIVSTVPAFFQRNKVNDIFPLFENENKAPQAVVIDFGRQRITSTKMIGIVESVQTYFRDEGTENFMLYGFNVKPHKKGGERPHAEDIGCYLKGISAIGGNYRLSMATTRIYFPPITAWSQLPKVVDESAYKYVSLDDERARNRLEHWLRDNLPNSDGLSTPNNNLSSKISKFNIDKVGMEAKDLSVMVRENDVNSLRKRLSDKEVAEILRNSRR